MIIYRTAIVEDTTSIANLHVASWREHYLGILRDDYFKSEIEDDLNQKWSKRLLYPRKDIYITVAENANQTVGFACTFLNENAVFGSLLDNLHVASQWHGHGIGKALMNISARWVQQKSPSSKYYLWVLEENKSARNFYEKMKGQTLEIIEDELPGGGLGMVARITWDDVGILTSL